MWRFRMLVHLALWVCLGPQGNVQAQLNVAAGIYQTQGSFSKGLVGR